MKRPSKKYKSNRAIEIVGDIAIVPLTRGYNAIIDASCVDFISEWNWCAIRSKKKKVVYAASRYTKDGKTIIVKMHSMILGDAPSINHQADHADGDGLNNRKSNLRWATPRQNSQNRSLRVDNSSGYKGVYLRKDLGKWQAAIRVDGKQTHLGYFLKKEDARDAYRRAAMQAFGEFARFD